MAAMAKRKVATDWPKRLRKLRDKLDLTQAEMAAKIGVSLRTYVYWEAGKFQPLKVWLQQIDRLSK